MREIVSDMFSTYMVTRLIGNFRDARAARGGRATAAPVAVAVAAAAVAAAAVAAVAVAAAAVAAATSACGGRGVARGGGGGGAARRDTGQALTIPLIEWDQLAIGTVNQHHFAARTGPPAMGGAADHPMSLGAASASGSTGAAHVSALQQVACWIGHHRPVPLQPTRNIVVVCDVSLQTPDDSNILAAYANLAAQRATAMTQEGLVGDGRGTPDRAGLHHVQDIDRCVEYTRGHPGRQALM